MYQLPFNMPEENICDPITGLAINVSLREQGVKKPFISEVDYQRILDLRKENGIAPIDDFGDK